MRSQKAGRRFLCVVPTLVRLGLAVCFGLNAAPALAQLGFFLPSPPSPLRQLFGDRVHAVACAGCTASVPFHTEKIIQLPYFISSLVWSPDGKYLAVGSLLESKVDIYDTSSWNLIGHIQAGSAGDATFVDQFTSDSQYLIRPPLTAVGTENVSLQKWDIKAGMIAGNFPSIFASEQGMPYGREFRDSYANAVATSATADFVAAAVGGISNGHILIYDSINYSIKQVILCAFRASPSAMAFSPDNHELVAGGCDRGNVVEAYDVDTGKMNFQTSVDRSAFVYSFIVYSLDGSMIAISSDNGEQGTITILRASDGSVLDILPRENAPITNLQWVGKNLLLASYDAVHPDGRTVRIWDISSGMLTGEYAGESLQLASLSPDRANLAAALGTDVVVGQLK